MLLLLRSLGLCAVLLALAVPVASAAGASGGTLAGSSSAPSEGATGGSDPTQQPPTAAPAPAGAGRADVPAAYLRLYRAAGKKYGVDWRVLAAIGKNESDHGRSRAPGVRSGLNFARCCAGPMQFCTVRSCGNTWGAYAIDGDGDGQMSVYDPADAVPAAARLVAALTRLVGARTDLVLASYNAGPAYAAKHRRVPPYVETRRYVANGLRYIRGL
ncbi:MAG: transglycosylase SLT domain-containing protein [Actinomycetota bacterium]|nr:transglycosylase SLT domain-containing protein [Actinomycetota bacterium]